MLQKKIAEMLILLTFFLLLLISAIFLVCFRVYFCLFGRFMSLKSKTLSDWIRQLKQKQRFCDWKRQCLKWGFVSDCTQFLDTNSIKRSWNLIGHEYNPKQVKSILIG